MAIDSNKPIHVHQFVQTVILTNQSSTRFTANKQTLWQHALQAKKMQGTGQAPVNIALSKYWGKRDSALNLPTNSSLSISLTDLGSTTTVSVLGDAQQDQVSLNDEWLPQDHPFLLRLSQYLDFFRANSNTFFRVVTVNSVPTAAGLASSASGYAALVLALNDLFAWQLSPQALSLLARLGSGSASRSLFSGFAIWHQGSQTSGLDSYAEPIDVTWPELCVGLIEVDITAKPLSSTQGMQQTTQSCALYNAWPKQANQDVESIHQAILAQDFITLGETAEHNALSMHATMIASWPPVLYWQPESILAMQTVWKLRQAGVSVFFTMDAGPNLKLLFLHQEKPAIEQAFNHIGQSMRVIEPFI